MRFSKFFMLYKCKTGQKKIDKKKDRVFGYAKGKITLKPGFDDPMEDLGRI
jgi:hypothetical protein